MPETLSDDTCDSAVIISTLAQNCIAANELFDNKKAIHLAIVSGDGKLELGKNISAIMLKIFGEIGEELFEVSDLSFCEAAFLVNFFETATNIFEKGTSHEIRMLERFVYNFSRHEIENMLNLAEMNKVGNEILAKGIRRVRTFCR